MATVLGWWCLPEEESHFLEYLDNWDIYAYPPETLPSPTDVKIAPLRSVILQKNPTQISFGPRQFLSENDVSTRNLVGEAYYYGVSSMQSHTICYSRPNYNIYGHLGKCNLSAYWKYPASDLSGFFLKDPEFVKWAKKVFAWGRKWASARVMLNGYSYPATPKVKQLVDQNKLIVSF